MSERLIDKDPLERVEVAVKKSLRDVGKRSQNPDLLDRIAVPVDRWVAETLAGMLGMSPEEIADLLDSE
ncbi:hypothetical protein IID22_02725 [Patescibacteria group bacterium]|nr:hypothetical protein [Patescibacteria group bacterium]